MRLPSDWNEFLRLLNDHRVRFLVVGAHALAAHGRPRATVDLDIFVEASERNAKRLGRALAAFGFPRLGEAASAFAEGERMASLGREPFRIDIMNSIAGVSFTRAWRGRLTARLGELNVGIIGRREFVANKRTAGRAKDLLDLELLEEGRTVHPRRRRSGK